MAKLILLTHDVIGEKMAGPGIRYWEFAKALSSAHQVTLFCTNSPDCHPQGFSCQQFTSKAFEAEMKGAHALLAQTFSLKMALLAKRYQVKLILDAYAPEMIEHLELFKYAPLAEQAVRIETGRKAFQFSMKIADFILCANDRQKDLWIGFLGALGKITPHAYAQDPLLENRIAIVPFGTPSKPPKITGPGFREKLHLRATDKLLLWGGGIWNWFDPLTLLQAISLLTQKRKDIHLLFMGMQHPSPAIPSMKMAKETLDLAHELGLKGKSVHFNFDWTPYNERQNVLLESDIGLSLHFDHLETRYAFRTRMLDYIWTSLPIVCTEGDYFSDLVNKHHLGISIPPNSPQACARAIEELIDNRDKIKIIKENLKNISPSFSWDKAVLPIHQFLEINSKVATISTASLLLEFIKQKGVFSLARSALRKMQ